MIILSNYKYLTRQEGKENKICYVEMNQLGDMGLNLSKA